MLIDPDAKSGLKRAVLQALLGASFLGLLSLDAASAKAQASAQTTVQATQPDGTSASQPLAITLDEALKRAQSSEPTYAMAVADS